MMRMTRLKPEKRRKRFDLSDCGKTKCAYYYFKFVRGKKQKDEDLDFFDDEGYEEDPYINEDEEPVIADDEDNGDETKETEETI